MLSYLVNVACLLVGINLFIALPISAVSDEEPTPIGFLKITIRVRNPMPTLASFLINVACAWVGLLLLSIPVWLSTAEPGDASPRKLAEHVLILLLAAVTLSALAS